jgi:biofilm PGA synthesis lipoprotein PgaB
MCGAVISGLRKIFKALVIAACLLLPVHPAGAADTFLVLCYHDVPKKASALEDVPQHIFVKQLEYLKTHGYAVVCPEDILAAQKGQRPLPDKAVLLTFDDAYRSFYDFVYPVLRLYGYPAVLSIVSSWIEQTPDYVKGKELMSWEQIKEVVESDLIRAASHSHDLHKGVIANPQGNEEAAASAAIYSPGDTGYETEEHFRKRIARDLRTSRKILEAKTGTKPRILTWPYGQFNRPAVDEAQQLGFELMLTLTPGAASVHGIDMVNRNIITSQIECEDFVSRMKEQFNYLERKKIRAVQIDLDAIVNPDSYERSDANLGLLIERLVAAGVNTVFLQGFCDRDGSGNIASLYYYNRTLPVVLDFLGHVTNRIRIRGMEVYIWMPVLSYELTDRALNERLKVRELTGAGTAVTTSWYRRLSPFDARSLDMVKTLYRDLAMHVRFDGILFQDDAYLAEHEDYHPAALDLLKQRYGPDFDVSRLKDDRFQWEWAQIKTATVNRFVEALQAEVRYFRPEAKFARNIYSEAVVNPASQEWLGQSFDEFVKRYDYTVIMAYPRMEQVDGMKKIKRWFSKMIDEAAGRQALDKVVFKVQSFDWSQGVWIPEKELVQELRYLLSRGVRHIAYYPVNVFENRPRIEKVVPVISAREFPESWNVKSLVEGN